MLIRLGKLAAVGDAADEVDVEPAAIETVHEQADAEHGQG